MEWREVGSHRAPQKESYEWWCDKRCYSLLTPLFWGPHGEAVQISRKEKPQRSQTQLPENQFDLNP